MSEVWVNPPVAEMDDQEDTALLLPPSEVAPMQRGVVGHEMRIEALRNDGMDDALNDAYLTDASGGRRVSLGTV